MAVSCSLSPVHCGASPGQVCGHAHQLVRQDQQTPAEGGATISVLDLLLF